MPTPATIDDVRAARGRLAPYLTPSPLRRHPPPDDARSGLALLVKHENVQPTGSFKVRNGLATVTALSSAERTAGVVGATTRNHGLGLAFAGKRLGVPVTICVPRKQPGEERGAARVGARVVEEGVDAVTDAEIAAAVRLILSTTHPLVEGAGALGVAAARKLAPGLRGQRVGVIFCGANMDTAVLRRILNEDLN